MAHTLEIKRELDCARHVLLDLKAELKFARFALAATKAGFNPDQPRDDEGRWTTQAGVTDFSAVRRKAVVDYSEALTGISTIDEITVSLSNSLARTMEAVDFIPEWTPSVYGTAVHVAFGTAVRLEGLRGVGFLDVEQSFLSGGKADYGDEGSIRTDVVLRNDIGDIIAIYDVKTGRSGLSASRVQEIRDHTGVQSNVPIIELNAVRGARIKSSPLFVFARLWRPENHRGSGYPAGDL